MMCNYVVKSQNVTAKYQTRQLSEGVRPMRTVGALEAWDRYKKNGGDQGDKENLLSRLGRRKFAIVTVKNL